MINVDNVRKVYGKKQNIFTALDGVSFKIEDGASVAIVGKSGSGKSTLMHVLALLDKPTEGTVAIDGQLSSTLSSSKQDLLRNQKFGFIFQQFFLNANETVLENVMLPLKIAGISRSERVRRAKEALSSVELLEKAKNKAKDLSGGQKQRVCIARALVNNPSIIFADEPTGNLDSVTGKLVEDLLFRLNKEQKITLIIVTHDEDLAKRCSKQLRIKDGKLEKGGK